MKPSKWLNAMDPERLVLDLERMRVSPRKLRLAACASVRRISHLLSEAEYHRAIEISEAFADGRVGAAELSRAHHEAVLALRRWRDGVAENPLAENLDLYAAFLAAAGVAEEYDSIAGYVITRALRAETNDSLTRVPADSERGQRKRNKQFGTLFCNLLRDIFGNPFRPVAFDPRWRTSDVVGLARAIYDDKAFERMPILADALMDAGCEDEQVIGHCRGDGPHVRGCWVVDLVLGKE